MADSVCDSGNKWLQVAFSGHMTRAHGGVMGPDELTRSDDCLKVALDTDMSLPLAFTRLFTALCLTEGKNLILGEKRNSQQTLIFSKTPSRKDHTSAPPPLTSAMLASSLMSYFTLGCKAPSVLQTLNHAVTPRTNCNNGEVIACLVLRPALCYMLNYNKASVCNSVWTPARLTKSSRLL